MTRTNSSPLNRLCGTVVYWAAFGTAAGYAVSVLNFAAHFYDDQVQAVVVTATAGLFVFWLVAGTLLHPFRTAAPLQGWVPDSQFTAERPASMPYKEALRYALTSRVAREPKAEFIQTPLQLLAGGGNSGSKAAKGAARGIAKGAAMVAKKTPGFIALVVRKTPGVAVTVAVALAKAVPVIIKAIPVAAVGIAKGLLLVVRKLPNLAVGLVKFAVVTLPRLIVKNSIVSVPVGVAYLLGAAVVANELTKDTTSWMWTPGGDVVRIIVPGMQGTAAVLVVTAVVAAVLIVSPVFKPLYRLVEKHNNR